MYLKYTSQYSYGQKLEGTSNSTITNYTTPKYYTYKNDKMIIPKIIKININHYTTHECFTTVVTQ